MRHLYRPNLFLRLLGTCLRFYLFTALAFAVACLIVRAFAGSESAFNLLEIIVPMMSKIGVVLGAEVALAIALESLTQ